MTQMIEKYLLWNMSLFKFGIAPILEEQHCLLLQPFTRVVISHPNSSWEVGELYIINFGEVNSSMAWGVSTPKSVGNTSLMLLPSMGVSAPQASLQGLRGFSW